MTKKYNLAEINTNNIKYIKSKVREIHKEIREIKKIYYHNTGNIEDFDRILNSVFGNGFNRHQLKTEDLMKLSDCLYHLMAIFNLKFKA